MQLGIDVTCMHTNFGGRGLFSFEDLNYLIFVSSATDGCCSSCQIAAAGAVCSEDRECAEESRCTGNSSTCPTPVYRNIPCNEGTRFCVKGHCTGIN